MSPRFIAVLDFESTCDARGSQTGFDTSTPEIIEFPVCAVDLQSRAVVGTFHSFVRPTLQPELTPFCTQLTTITQGQLSSSPTIPQALHAFEGWCASQRLTAENTLVATCGDWDLRRMWAAQVAIAPSLVTPALFKRWCNLKVIFQRQEGQKATGMMGMLRHAGLEHQGVHHRGIDDVRNLCRLVLWMLAQGTAVVATWTAAERKAEAAHYTKKLAGRQQLLADQRVALERLPQGAPEHVRRAKMQQLDQTQAQLAALQARRDVFT